MNSRKRELNIQLWQIFDAAMLGLLLWLCYELRKSGFFIIDSMWEIPPFPQFFWMLAILMPFGPFLLEMQGFYAQPLERNTAKSLQQIFRAGLWLMLFFGAVAFLLRVAVPSRSVLLLFAMAAPVCLLLRDRLAAIHYHRQLARGEIGESILVAGEPHRIRQFCDGLTPGQRLETRIVETVDLLNGGVGDLVAAIHTHAIGRVILTFDKLELEKVQQAVEACELEGVEAWLSADFIHTSVARPTYETFGRKPMLVFRATPEVSWSLLVKAFMDRAGAFFLLVLLSPMMLLAALAVRLGSRGPVIFRQERAGLHGRPFTMFKFRTMCVDAEERKRELEPRNEMRGPVFKVGDDPRVTAIGKFLRRTSIDELPQLFNVLRGEMSLVGPRPLPTYEVERFESTAHRRRLSMKPGLTCLWQVRGRNRVTDFDDWVRMDLEYIDNWSLALDILILVRTVPAVFAGWGAR